MRKILKIFLLFLVVIFLSVYLYIEVNVVLLEKKVMNYLLENKGYQEVNIKNLKGSFGKLPPFSVLVIFRDEPFVVYYYKEESGEIIQFAHSLTDEVNNNSVKLNDIKELKHKE